MSFISDLMKSTEELEPPRNFWLWAGLTSISAVVMDNVWLPRGGDYYNTYPNIYVMFHADSGLKKGPPVALAKQLVQRVNCTRVITGRSSIQGILKDLGTAFTSPGGFVNAKSTAFICSSELSSSIVDDKSASDILTDLYDRNWNDGPWKSLLKMETFELKNPTVTMLTATNEAHNNEFFGQKDIMGGFFARTFIINETEDNGINSLIYPLNNPINKDKMVEYLKLLTKLRGPFCPLGSIVLGERTPSPAGRYYDEWYIDFKRTIKEQKVKDDTGTINRFGDAVLKVAMLISLSKDPERLEITLDSMMEAVARCETLIGNIRKVTHGQKGKSQYTQQKTMVIHELLKRNNHTITRQQLLQKYWMHFDTTTFDEIIYPSLNTAGIVNMENNGGVILYTMPEEQVKELSKFFEGKDK